MNISGKILGIVVLVSLIGSSWLYSQPGLPGDPAQAPLGSEMLILLLGGIIVGIRSILKRNRNKH